MSNKFTVVTQAPTGPTEDKWSASSMGLTTFGKTETIALRRLFCAILKAKEVD